MSMKDDDSDEIPEFCPACKKELHSVGKGLDLSDLINLSDEEIAQRVNSWMIKASESWEEHKKEHEE